jgi:hydroxyacyl-ACP dehydratase HTD2-like protein with hotdog domain
MVDVPASVLQLIGLEKVRNYEVTPRDIKRFAQAIGDSNPKYGGDDPGPPATCHPAVAPPLICQMFAFEDVGIQELPPDGSPAEINVPLPAVKTVGGGSVFEIFDRIRPGDRITATSKIADVYRKEGRSGTLFFVSVETTFHNQHQRMVSRETATFIKR